MPDTQKFRFTAQKNKKHVSVQIATFNVNWKMTFNG